MAYDNAENYGIEAFKQTNLTMLVEKFAALDENAHPIESLDKLLEKSKDVQNDTFYKKVIEKLAVKSFEDFVYKFQPYVYKKVEEISSGDKTTIKTTFSLEKEGTTGEPIPLSNTAFYKMINELYERRKTSGQTRTEFDYKDVAQLLCPEAEVKAIKQLRSSMEYNTLELYRLEDAQPGVPSDEKNECIQAIIDGRLQYQSFLNAGIDSAMLLQLTDAQESLLKITEKAESISDESDEDSSTEIKLLTRYYDDEGNIQIKYVEQDKKKESEDNDAGRIKLLEAFDHDFEEYAPEEIKSKAIKDLVLSTVSSLAIPTTLNKADYLQRLKNCEKTYKESMESLCEAITPLVEKFLGVRALFENTGKKELEFPLVVTNCSADELLSNDKIKKNFKDFLAHFSKMKAANEWRFWFAVIPAVALGNETGKEVNSSSYDPFGDITLPKSPKKVKGLVSAQEAKALMEIFAKNEIMVFFNYKGTKNNCLDNFDKDTYKKIKKTITFAGSEPKNDGSYAVCCLPNFTVLSESDSNIVINKELHEKGIVAKPEYISVPGIYVDAAYVAAGMMIGSQESDVLKEKDLIVEDSLTCVKVDFEDKMVKNHYYSTMPRDSQAGLPSEIEEDQAKCKFGFFFSDGILKDKNNKKNANAYVLNARTLREENQKYWKLSNVLFAKYVNLCIFDGQPSATEDNISKFENEVYQEWTSEQQSLDQTSPEERPVNTMLKIDWNNKDKKESINFIPVKKDVAAIEINYLEDKAKLTVKVK